MKTNRIPFTLKDYESGKYNKVMYYNHEVRILATDLKGGRPILFSYFDANYNADVIERNNGGELTLEETVFEDGDIIYTKNSAVEMISIFNCFDKNKDGSLSGTISTKAIIAWGEIYKERLEQDSHCDSGGLRLATDNEKQRLFDALAKDGKRWNAEKKCIEDIKKEYKFKPFDRVLVRDYDEEEWGINLFSHYASVDSYRFVCSGNEGFNQCIPYEGNEELLGTTNSPKK